MFSILVGVVCVAVIQVSATTKGKNCNYFCAEIWSPVCGSNGKTYSNLCSLNIATCKDSSVTLASTGECKKDCNHACYDVYAPVCGSDGKTYSNDCELQRATCIDSSVILSYTGECRKGSKDGTVCDTFCTEEYSPLCGSDRNTYSNRCYLGIATCKDSTIKLAYRGECRKCSDGCFDVYAPVCGNNGKTYGNICELNRESCLSGKKIEVKSRGRC